MKIAVIGSHGTGKTTICRGLAKKFRLNYIPDIVAEAFRLKFPINESTPPETQLWILSKQLELERNTPEHWIMEKSLWDNIIYGEFSIKDTSVTKVIKEIVEKNASYDLVFYCPIEFPIPDDGLRSLNKNFQEAIDSSFRQYLNRHKIQFIELHGDEQTRLNYASSLIDKIIKKKHSISR